MKVALLCGVAIFALIATCSAYTPSATVQWYKCGKRTPQDGREKSPNDGINVNYQNILAEIREKLGLSSSDFQYSPQKHKYVTQIFKNQMRFPFTPFNDPEKNYKFDTIFAESQKKAKLRIGGGRSQRMNVTAFDEELKLIVEENQPRAAMPDPHFSAIECAKINVPLMWEYSEDPSSVQSFVKRFKSKNQPAKGRIWLLQGGPGGDSTVFESYASILMEELDFQYDLYLIDHRGTGRSAPLPCDSTSPSDVQRCTRKYIAKYAGKPEAFRAFGTTYAALDLGHWISLMKGAYGGKDVVYGVSYGTWWLNRLLAYRGYLVDMAVADSVVTPGTFDFLDWDSHFPEVGDELIKLCEADTFCSKRLSVHPVTGATLGVRKTFELAFKQSEDAHRPDPVEANQCSRIFSPLLMKTWFAISLQNDEMRKIAFPMVYRLLRCSNSFGDSSFLSNLHYALSNLDEEGAINLKNPQLFKAGGDEPVYGGIQELLYTNVVCSEIAKDLDKKDPKQYIEKYYRTTPPFFWANSSAVLIEMCKAYKDANGGYTESGKDSMANYNKPILTIQGTLDPQTPYLQSLDWKKHYTKQISNSTQQQFVAAKNSYHGAMFATRTSYYLMPMAGMRMVAKWILADGLKPAESQLLNSYKDYEIDFSAATATLASVSYTLDLWDGIPQFDIEQLMTLSMILGVVVLCLLLCCNCCLCCFVCVGFLSISSFVVLVVVVVASAISAICCGTSFVGSCSFCALLCCCGCCGLFSRKRKAATGKVVGKGDLRFQELQEDEGKLSINSNEDNNSVPQAAQIVGSVEITPDNDDQAENYETPAL